MKEWNVKIKGYQLRKAATKEAKACPESTYTSTSRKDIYNDWFESLDEAQAFVAQSKCA